MNICLLVGPRFGIVLLEEILSLSSPHDFKIILHDSIDTSVFAAPVLGLITQKRINLLSDIPPQTDVILLLFWPNILSPSELSLLPVRPINIHPGYLPYGRGKDPNFWSLINEHPPGASLHYIDSTIDGGQIIMKYQANCSILSTGLEVYNSSLSLSLRLLHYFFIHIESIVCGLHFLHDQPYTTDEHEASQHINYRRGLENMSSIEGTEMVRVDHFLRLALAKTCPPYEPLKVVLNGQSYYLTINLSSPTAS